MKTIRQAIPADLRTVLEILHGVARSLHERGIDQWPVGSPNFTREKIGSQIDRGEFWIVSDGRDPIAVIAISPEGDTDFWTPGELAEPAMYLSKAAVVRSRAGEGIGAMLFRWATDYAYRQDMKWVRLDAWRTNTDLHDYYRRQGWDYVRTVDAPGRNSGTLFARRAFPDIDAREAFTEMGTPAPGQVDMAPGTPVIAVTPDGPVAAVVTNVIGPDYSQSEVPQGWEYGIAMPRVLYEVSRDGQTMIKPTELVWPDPAGAPNAYSGTLPDSVVPN